MKNSLIFLIKFLIKFALLSYMEYLVKLFLLNFIILFHHWFYLEIFDFINLLCWWESAKYNWTFLVIWSQSEFIQTYFKIDLTNFCTYFWNTTLCPSSLSYTYIHFCITPVHTIYCDVATCSLFWFGDHQVSSGSHYTRDEMDDYLSLWILSSIHH